MREASAWGVEFRSAVMPPVVGRPATLMLSLMSTGMQWSGPLKVLLCVVKKVSSWWASERVVGFRVLSALIKGFSFLQRLMKNSMKSVQVLERCLSDVWIVEILKSNAALIGVE